MKDQSIIIFDFDGTIADSAPIIRKIYAELATKNGWAVMTDEAYLALRKGSIREAKKWSGVHFWQFPLVLRSARQLMKLESEKVELFPGIVDLIHELKSQGHELYVLSRNSQDTINRVLERYELQDELKVLSRRRRTLGSKTAVIRSLVKLKRYKPEHVWMIGDEVRDVAAGNKAGVQTIAVSWGMQDALILSQYNPTHMAHTVDQLRGFLQ